LISRVGCVPGRATEEVFSWCVSAVCLGYALLVSIVFQVWFVAFLTVFLLLKMGRVDDAFRLHNTCYGAYMVRMFWPFVRVERSSLEHARRPHRGDVGALAGERTAYAENLKKRAAPEPVMMVTNHRSLFDIFFFGLTLRPNTVALVRPWPFAIPVLGWFMRRAGYIDIERMPFEEAVERVRALSRRGVSCLCFAEGHRSRDGRLQRFRSGAFRLAVECNLPVLPVCLTGTERLCAPGSHQFRPARVVMKFFPEIDPASFSAHKRALRLRRHVEDIFREYLGE